MKKGYDQQILAISQIQSFDLQRIWKN